MGIRAEKRLKTILCGVGLIALAAVSGILGAYLERNRQNLLKSQEKHISTIAVVNMDNGVTVGEEQINYASQLLSFPNSDFTTTGLTDAKAGLENGSYAAYVVIPETFSASVASVENDPQKTVLVYQYSYYLDEEARIQAVNNINAFVNLLNSNVAYMYMDAILAEFHRIQDDSAAILANDNRERETLAGVDASELIAAAAPVEEITVDNEILPVELASYSAQNDALLNYMLSGYLEAVQRGKEDFAVLKEESAGVGTAVDSFFTAYETGLQNTAAEQEQLLAAARDRLAEAVGLYDQGLETQEEQWSSLITEIMDLQLEADRAAANAQLQEILENLGNSDGQMLEEMRQQWENAYQTAQAEAAGNLQQRIAGCSEGLKDLLQNVPCEGLTPELEAYLADMDAAADELLGSITEEGLWPELQLPSVSGGDADDSDGTGEEAEILLTAFDNGDGISDRVKDTLAQFQMEAGSEEISNVIQTCFVDALSEANAKQLNGLSEAGTMLRQSIEEYEGRLAGYDPFQYIENANLSAYVNEIGANAGEMLHTVEQNNHDYMLYASEMYAAAREHAAQVRGSLSDANAQTVQNVEECIDGLILSRETINDQNIKLLKGFTDSLLYTRVGSQGNAQVYDYLVNPVAAQSQSGGQTGASAPAPVQKEEISPKAALTALLGIGIFICMAEVILGFRRQYKQS